MSEPTAPEPDATYFVQKALVLPCLEEVRRIIVLLIEETEKGPDEVPWVYRNVERPVFEKPPTLCSCNRPGFFQTFLPSEILERIDPLLTGLWRGLGR